ncbi:hypothetical protein NHX12_017396 [Muraenolepis orangiensis]|uniref:protein-serine/threonine phosphatase n=1 Tax=Muraenolepis orangiensis TaxID=630683 RepID=A0A9Q0F080_9TELE|nr:hypothetical protein NHX12_017396 [Muraenolepis orangiensis]
MLVQRSGRPSPGVPGGFCWALWPRRHLISQLLDPVVDPWLGRDTGHQLIPVAESYSGPRISFPLSVSHTDALLTAFKEHQILHASYALQLLWETKKLLKQMPNIVHMSTSYAKEITICGRQ